jgi:hypothetical protein
MFDNRVLSIRLELEQNLFTNLKLFVSACQPDVSFNVVQPPDGS